MTWLAAVLVVLAGLCADHAANAASFQTLEIVTKSGVRVFSVEMATTEEQARGLMCRQALAAGQGMLFDF